MFDLGVALPNSKIHSRSWRGMPVHAQIRCLMSTCRVVAASPSLNEGYASVTGSSQRSFFSSTSSASSSVVIAFVLDAAMKSVSLSTFAGLPSSFTPRPPSHTTLPPSMNARPTPGTSSCFMPSATNFFSVSMRAASSGCALRPANVSRW